MKFYAPKQAFTLVEVLVAIAIIVLLALGLNSLDFGKMSNRQKAEIFANKVSQEIERVRNNALVGKGVTEDDELILPESWEITFTGSTNEGDTTAIETSYSGSTEKVTENTLSIDPKLEKIIKINCGDPNDNHDSITITFTGREYSFSSPCESATLLELTLSFVGEEYIVTFDRINGLVERKRNKK